MSEHSLPVRAANRCVDFAAADPAIPGGSDIVRVAGPDRRTHDCALRGGKSKLPVSGWRRCGRSIEREARGQQHVRVGRMDLEMEQQRVKDEGRADYRGRHRKSGAEIIPALAAVGRSTKALL